MHCELNTSDTLLEPLDNFYANSIHAALGVNELAAVKNSFTSDGILYIKDANKNIENKKNNLFIITSNRFYCNNYWRYCFVKKK